MGVVSKNVMITKTVETSTDRIGDTVNLKPVSCLPFPHRPSEVAGRLLDVDDSYYHLQDALGAKWSLPKSRWQLHRRGGIRQ